MLLQTEKQDYVVKKKKKKERVRFICYLKSNLILGAHQYVYHA